METSRKRIGWIDAARAFAMFLIVLGHAFQAPTPLEDWVYTCHVPLFLWIGGMVFLTSDEPFSRFLRKRFFSIVIPYLCFATISILIYAVIGNRVEAAVADGRASHSLVRNLLGMLWGNAKGGAMRWNRPLWFLPMYFTMELAAYWLLRGRGVRALLVELALSIAAAWTVYALGGGRLSLPWDLETVLFLMPFFIAGQLFRSALPRIVEAKSCARLTIGAATLALGAALVPLNGRVMSSADEFGNHYGLFLLISALLAIGILLLFSLRQEGAPALNYIGRNTLGILLMHKFPIMFFAVLPLTRGLFSAHPISMPMIVALVSIGLCAIAIEVLRKIAPWAIGLRRER